MYNVGDTKTDKNGDVWMWIEGPKPPVLPMEIYTKAKARGIAFINLFAASKQLVDNFPKRFPYLEYFVKEIERENLAPKLEDPTFVKTPIF